MPRKPSKEEDQLARFGEELQDGNWLAHAQQRSKRRKSAWNYLLPLFGFPIWAAFTASLVWLGHVIRSAFHPHQPPPVFSPGPMSASDTLVSIASFIVAIPAAMLVTNFLVYRIAPARRAMEAEDRNFPGVGYRSSQHALFKLWLWLLAICLPLILVGAALK